MPLYRSNKSWPAWNKTTNKFLEHREMYNSKHAYRMDQNVRWDMPRYSKGESQSSSHRPSFLFSRSLWLEHWIVTTQNMFLFCSLFLFLDLHSWRRSRVKLHFLFLSFFILLWLGFYAVNGLSCPFALNHLNFFLCEIKPRLRNLELIVG